jgi:ribosomal protein S18 acetylase RimI-like enzyme
MSQADDHRRMLRVRPAILPDDAPAIAAMDTAFHTRQVFRVTASDDAIRFSLSDLDRPRVKRFPLADLTDPDRPWSHGWIATQDERVIGFTAAAFASWNLRLVIWHLYVDQAARGRGIARRLLEPVEAHGAALGARHLWLETSSINVPGVAAYRALGFRLVGADLTLYDGTEAEGETALFFARTVL